MSTFSPRGSVRASHTLQGMISVLHLCENLVMSCTDIDPWQCLSLLHVRQDLSLLACWKLQIPGLLALHDGTGCLLCPLSWQRQMDSISVSYFCSSASSCSSLCCFCVEGTVLALLMVTQLSPAHPCVCSSVLSHFTELE